MLLILAEKPSAAKKFAIALGGMTGRYDNVDYRIVSLFGHLMEFKEPHEMVHEDYMHEMKGWEPGLMPWRVDRMTWAKQPKMSINPRTKRKASLAKEIQNIKRAAADCDAIVIATDIDPSGEGQLLAWEVIDAIGWRKSVKRMYFYDEEPPEVQKAFKNMKDLPVKEKDGEYVKADARSKWDFLSMQLTRIATSVVRAEGYNTVPRQGRLKSVEVYLVDQQLKALANYKKTPYYEVKYKDENDHVYARTVKTDEADGIRFAVKRDAEIDQSTFLSSSVIQDSITRKKTAPGKLLDLGGLASILARKGFKPKEVLSTYQKMYEAGIVSYPRTEDKTITLDQYNEMLPLVDKIAAVVGLDSSLMTYRKPRNVHVKSGGAHGANRPGVKVPTSLQALDVYGSAGPAIYNLLSRNFLAIFGEDYEYDEVKGHIKDYPDFVTKFAIQVSSGFKAIFDTDSETKDKDEDEVLNYKPLGVTGKSFVDTGFNKKPPRPTMTWLEKQLTKYNVGTGATRVNTLAEITAGKYALLTETKGVLGMTQIGEISAVLLDGAMISDVKVTEELFLNMKAAGEFKITTDSIINSATDLIIHDKQVFIANSKKLKALIGPPKGSVKKTMGQFEQKEKVEGIFVPTGATVRFNKKWSTHEFTDEEVAKLLQGEMISFPMTSAAGNPYTAQGSLKEQVFKDKPFWGFKMAEADEFDATTAAFPKEWSSHVFSPNEEAKLRAGERVTIDVVWAKSGQPGTVDVSFELSEYNGNKRWAIKPHFNN